MDKQFFSEEVKTAERSLYRLARCYLHTDVDAADAVQEALLRAWAKRETLREFRYFRTWLTRIVINVCKDELKRCSAQAPVKPLPVASADNPEREWLQEALQALDVKYRVPLVLFYLDGYTIKQIAQLLHMTQGTVKSRLYRAKEKLRIELSSGEDRKNEDD